MADASRRYKIALTSGRVLGPIQLDRIRLLILKNHIRGEETARQYPDGEWRKIHEFPEIAELIAAKLAGQLKDERETTEYRPILGESVDPYARTILQSDSPDSSEASEQDLLPGAEQSVSIEIQKPVGVKPSARRTPELEKTKVRRPRPSARNEEKTIVSSREDETQVEVGEEESTQISKKPKRNHEKTVWIQKRTLGDRVLGRRNSWRRRILEPIFALVAAAAIGSTGYDVFLSEPPQKPFVRPAPVRPKLPDSLSKTADPGLSTKIYAEGVKFYLQDTVEGYRLAAEKFRKAAGYDPGNVKALALLASSYINLIDSSNKDEKYFEILAKLIEMSRAKKVDLPETVIANVEFYLVVNKGEAAQNQIIEYTKAHPSYGLEMFYYLALVFFNRGDLASAATFIGKFPDSKVYTAKIYYLRGQLAEKLNDLKTALEDYGKAMKFNPNHAKSYLRAAQILNNLGKLNEAKTGIEFLVNHPNLLSPIDLGRAYYLHAQSQELDRKWEVALYDMERAVQLEPENHDYLLELYTLRAKGGGPIQGFKKAARMYYFMGEGEKLIQKGQYQEALIELLRAREADDQSPAPLVKIGDLFGYMNNIEEQRRNYKLAAKLAPNSIEIWSKYIQVLIQSYEWAEATEAMDRFRKLQVSQSAIDKAAGDLLQKQGNFREAQVFYRKAMSRQAIDPSVYLAYAKSLMSTKNYKDAQFFFALALRGDPLNLDAVIQTAKCIAETDSIDHAISMLQDELNQRSGGHAELLSAIAEFRIQKGEWGDAQQVINQALQANPDYGYAYKVQAQIYMNQEGIDKKALDKALDAYKSFSDRNPSDPTGYFERYKIFARKSNYEKAGEELNRVYEIYPKYPNLHFYLGALYALQGNHAVAVEEFKKEVANHPNSVQGLIALGRELLEMGNATDALKYFTQAMQLEPRSSEAKQNAGWANRALRNYPAAVALLSGAIAIDRANPTLYKRLGIVYRDMGDYGAACKAFKKYLEMEPDAPEKADFQGCR